MMHGRDTWAMDTTLPSEPGPMHEFKCCHGTVSRATSGPNMLTNVTMCHVLAKHNCKPRCINLPKVTLKV